MKKKLFTLLCCLFSLGVSAATTPSTTTDSNSVKKSSSYPYIETKMGYFFFTSATMRHVYNDGGFDIQLSGSYPLDKAFPLGRYFRVYGSVEYLQKSGHSLSGDQKTSFWAVPISLGLQPVFEIYSKIPISYYFTIGPRYVFTGAHNHSSYVSSHMNSSGFGGFFNTGFLFKLYKHLSLDLFGEYSYTRLSYHSSVLNSQGRHTQVGGLTFGGGVAYAF